FAMNRKRLLPKGSSPGRKQQSMQSGFALALVLLILLVLLVLGAAVLSSTATNAIITGNYRTSNETFEVANAGLERAVNWFADEYTRFSTSSYSITAFGVLYNGSPVTLIGIAPNPSDPLPPSNFPKDETIKWFKDELSEHKVEFGD